MADNIIQIEIGANLTGLTSGLEKSARAVQTSAQQMGESAKSAATQTSEATEGITASFREAAAAVGESLAEMKEQMATAAESMQAEAFEVGSAMSGIGALIGAGFAGDFLGKLQETEIELSHLSDATGMSIASLSEMRGSMQQSGVDTTRFSDTMARLSEHLTMAREGSKQEAEAFAALGVTSADLANKSFTVQDVLMKIADRMHAAGGSTDALGQGYLLLGRQAVELTGWLSQGSAAIREQMSGLSSLGDQAQKSAAAAMQMRQEEAVLSQQLTAEVLPVFRGLVDVLEDLGKAFFLAQGGWNEFVDLALGGAQAVTGAVGKMADVFGDLLHGNFARAKLDARGVADTFEVSWQNALSSVNEDARKSVEAIDSLNSKIADSALGAGMAGGGAGGAAGAGELGAGKSQAAWQRLQQTIAETAAEEHRMDQQGEIDLARSTNAEMAAATKAMNARAALVVKRIEAQNQAAGIEASAEQAHQIAMIEIERNGLDAQVQLHRMSASQREAIEQQLEDRIYQIKLAGLQRQLSSLVTLDPDYPAKRAQLLAQIEALQDQHEAKMAEIANRGAVAIQASALKVQQSWQRAIEGITRAFQTSMQSVMSGTESIGQAFDRMGSSILAVWTQNMEQMLVKFVETHVIMRQVQGATAREDNANAAARAAGNAFNAVVGIPIVGPILAPPAAAAAFAAVEAFGGGIASAAGGQWEVPRVQMTMLHPQEMVLPANLAAGLRQTVLGGGGGAQTINFHVHATDAASVQALFERNGRTLAKVLAKQLRQGVV